MQATSMSLAALLTRAARIKPDGISTVCGARTRTWGETEDRVSRMASGLRSLGARKGDPIAILSMNSDWFFEYYFATAWAGAVANPMNIRHARPEIAHCLRQSHSRILFVDSTFASMASQLRAEVESLEHLIYIGEGSAPAGFVAGEELLRHATRSEPARLDDLDPLAIYYTGGTTGYPKGVVGSVRGMMLVVTLALAYWGRSMNAASIHVPPLFHGSGLIGCAVGTALMGAQVIPSKFEPGELLALIERYRPDTMVGAPVMLNMMLDHPDFAKRDLSGLKSIIYGMAPMPEQLLRRLLQALPHIRFMQSYGQSETGAPITQLMPEDHDPDGPHPHRLRSAGQPTFLAEVKIVGENGEELPRNAVGEIWVRSPMSMLGYLNAPEETAKVLHPDGWVKTGDAAYMDPDGYVYIVDRLKDMIISGGENIYSAEVELVIGSHPAVDTCAVIGIPDDKWGERVHAIVTLRSDQSVSADQLIAHCRGLIAGYKCPRSVEIRIEPLPTNSTGKVLKRELRAPYWANKSRNVN